VRLVEKPEGKRPLGRRGRRLEDNIKMDLKGTVLGSLRVLHAYVEENFSVSALNEYPCRTYIYLFI
jgi:hypothetical protein